MYKHLLLPTDGTELSEASVRSAIALAHEHGAKVTGLYVMPDYQTVIYGADALMTNSSAEFDRSVNLDADKALSFVEAIAKQEGVPYDLAKVTSNSTYKAIIQHAKDKDCDLIFMASHGRKGISGLLLGSETQKVLTHTSVPVLVYRSA
jgi:nucleotide-binding universal stress UspA family protein